MIRRLVLLGILTTARLEAQAPMTIAYVDNGTSEQVMDIHWPSSQPTATVLFIHGGSLQESGERRTSVEYRDVCTQFVKSGVACASMDYRLAPSHSWPAMPNDVARAIVALRKRVSGRGGNPGKLFLFGHSSGCHLAAIVTTNPVFLSEVGLRTTDIAGVIPMGCLLDRDDATIRRLTADQIRGPFMREQQDVATFRTPEAYLAANPASFIGKHVPPTLVIVADAERFMPPLIEQGSRFVRLLLENQVPANVLIVPGTHMSSITGVARAGDPTLLAILKFMKDPRAIEAAH